MIIGDNLWRRPRSGCFAGTSGTLYHPDSAIPILNVSFKRPEEFFNCCASLEQILQLLFHRSFPKFRGKKIIGDHEINLELSVLFA